MLLQAQYPPKTSYHSKSMPCYAIWPLVISLPSSTFSFPSITHLAPVIMVFLFFLDHVELVPVSEQTGICCSFCLMGSFPEIFIACTLKSQKYHFFLDSFLATITVPKESPILHSFLCYTLIHGLYHYLALCYICISLLSPL